MSTSREYDFAQAFVELSDTLVADFDVVDFLHVLAGRCVELLAVQAAGIMIGDQRGALRVMASSSEKARLLELFEVETSSGPCVDCYRRGTPVADIDLDEPDSRWREFAGRARADGFRAVHAVPVRLRGETIGVLNLFSTARGPLDDTVTHAAKALANVTALGLLQHRAVEYRQILAEQVQHAMNSRVTIEQAKGVLAERLDMDMEAAFTELRRYAARTGDRLGDIATAVTTADYGPLENRTRILVVRRFDITSLAGLRHKVDAVVAGHGLAGEKRAGFVLAVHEAAANAVEHGGGAGQLLLWLRAGTFYAEISDQGAGLPADYRVALPTPVDSLEQGRGLWLINTLYPDMELNTGPTGTRLMVRHPGA
ncbi:anti-sigma regulatory factor (Ser/Thr protein kinase) [Actinoplanes lutulentus]|uniref:ANTAR domain-containing protein n=1 Tax=Actinoplanes lutulentus TaxID=1287878 RepID=UPI00180C6A36|nr:ANTAR domain-containing protein [Actinoplanes lutulentus]MBB2940363.1 anti-sigma regulatory factor (Ser/Thr protein kinase) [Actinoplanes lutulentus]